MKSKKRIRAAALGLGLAGMCSLTGASLQPESGTTTNAQASSHDAKALEIMDKSIEATGGAEKLSSVESMKQTGTISVPMAGLNGTMTTWVKPPDMMMTVVELPGMGTTRQGVRGDIAWSMDQMSGPRLLTEAEATELRREIDLTRSLDFREEYPTIEYVEQTTFDGKEAHKLRLVDGDGAASTQYYGVDSGLLIGSERTVETQMGPTPMTMYMREYEEMGGIKQPTKMVQKVGPTEVIITIDSVSYEKIDDAQFELPQAVKALVDAKEEKENSDG